jgi:hypothetical protein
VKEALTSRIAAVAVSAQQHGTVYLNRQAETNLIGLGGQTPGPGFDHGRGGSGNHGMLTVMADVFAVE